jgi:DNA-binding response OmpR family regulator
MIVTGSSPGGLQWWDRGGDRVGSTVMGHTVSVTDRILVVEDDPRIRAALRLTLEDEQYDIVESASAEDALQVLAGGHVDLALVDLMLPGMNGFDLCRAIRKTDDLPIVIVTARDDTHDVVAGLEAGADDYIRKPFQPKELTARLRALLRRARQAHEVPGRTRVGSLDVRPDAGIVMRAGDPVALTKTEFLLLCELTENIGVVLSRDQLLERVWGYDYLGDGRLVDAHIRRLRAKVEEDPAHPTLIVTVRGLGYRMERI